MTCSIAPANSSSDRSVWRRVVPAAAAIVATGIVLLIPLSEGSRAAWMQCLLDIGHIPLFALLTIVLWRAFPGSILSTVAVSVGFAGAFELAQLFVGRTVDSSDFLRGVLGSLLGAVSIHVAGTPRSRWRIAVCSVILAAGLIWPVREAAPVVLDAYRQHQTFPILCDFRYEGDIDRWYTRAATLRRVRTNAYADEWAGQFDCTPPTWGTGAGVLFPAIRDWSGYRQLCFELSFSGAPIHFLFSVRDGRKVEPPDSRFDMNRRLEAGRHTVRIDLEALARGDEFAPLDLSRIESVHFEATALKTRQSVLLHRVYLR